MVNDISVCPVDLQAIKSSSFRPNSSFSEAMANILRQKTQAERIRIGFNLWASVRKMLSVHLRQTHPEWSSEVLGKEVARRLSRGAV